MAKGVARFHIYRYQLLPKDRYFQGDLYGAKTIEEVINRKNDLFAEALLAPSLLKNAKIPVVVDLVRKEKDFFVFRLAANRSLQHETPDFKTEVLDNWPKILVAVWNDPSKQLLAVQHRTAAFQDTAAVARMLVDSIAFSLARSQLRVLLEKVVEAQEFWNLVSKNSGRITALSFELVTPNMASISGDLPKDLTEFAKRTNAVKTEIEIKCDEAASLNITKNDPAINKLVQYSADGGGEVSIQIRGSRRKIYTKGVKELHIEEASLKGSAADVANVLKALLSDF